MVRTVYDLVLLILEVQDLIEKENDDRFLFYNVSLANLRGDAHSRPDQDCLHTCLPGPVDDWNRFLHHEISKLVIDQVNASSE